MGDTTHVNAGGLILAPPRRRLHPSVRRLLKILVAVVLLWALILVTPRILYKYRYPPLELIVRRSAGIFEAGPKAEIDGCGGIFVSRIEGQRVVVGGVRDWRFSNPFSRSVCAGYMVDRVTLVPLTKSPFLLTVEYRGRAGVYEFWFDELSVTVRLASGDNVAPPATNVWRDCPEPDFFEYPCLEQGVDS